MTDHVRCGKINVIHLGIDKAREQKNVTVTNTQPALKCMAALEDKERGTQTR